MRTAEEDELIRRSPCRIKGAGIESSPERPVATLVQVYEIADRIGPRYRALVLVATFGSLRWGELLRLQRIDVDRDARTIRVRRAYQEVAGKLVVGPPKSAAGSRTVTKPSLIVPRAAVAPSVLRGGGSGRAPVHRA
jgi:integrase